jgi:hypothetical protein
MQEACPFVESCFCPSFLPLIQRAWLLSFDPAERNGGASLEKNAEDRENKAAVKKRKQAE